MKDIAVRYLNTGRRVVDFTEQRATAFPAHSRGSELFTVIRTAVATMETEGAKQEAAERDRKEATDRKEAARAGLLGRLRQMNRTARGMKKLVPGISSQFAMPRTYGDQAVLNTARVFREAASTMTAEFTARGLPDDFLTALDASIQSMEEAIDAQDEALGQQTAATAAVAAAQRQLIDALGEFSPIVRNQFQDDPATLAAWKSASRVERAPHKPKTKTKTQTPQPTA
jgi:hypothetical protein